MCFSVADDRPRRPVLPLILTMAWIVGLPVFLLFGNRLPISLPLLKADRLAFLIALAPFLVVAVRRPRSLQPLGRIELAMLLYSAAILISWVFTLHGKSITVVKQDADFLLTCFVMPYAAFLIARNTEWQRERVITCMWMLVGGVGTYLVLFGMAQYGYDWSFLVPDDLKAIHPDRAKGPFDNAVPYGLVVSMLLLLALFLYQQATRRSTRIVLIAMCFGLLESIVASKTRAAWLAVPVALLLPSLRFPRIRVITALLTADLALQVLIAPAIGLDFWGMHRRLTQPEPVDDRIALSATASNMVEHRPVTGFGFGMLTFQENKTSYYKSWGGVSTRSAVYPNNPHNDFLNVLVMMGVGGLLAYIFLLGTNWQLLWRAGRRDLTRPFVSELATFVQGVFVIVLIGGQFHSVMHMAYVQILIFFLLGIVAREAAAPRLTPVQTRESIGGQWDPRQGAGSLNAVPQTES